MSASKTNDTSTLLLKLSSLQAELSHLQHRYDALLASKERAASRYKADYKKWRDFKLWLSKNFNCDKEIHSMLKDTDYGVDRTPSGINKRRKLDGMGPPPTAFDHPEMSNKSALTRTHAGFHADRTDSDPAPDASSKQQMVSPPVHRLREQTVSTKVEMQPLTPSKLLRPLQEHSAGKDIFNEELPAGTPVLQSTNSRQDLHQRRGRYAQATKTDTINSRFTICKERNHGMDFQYDDVVKGREERKKMLADDCECCRDYYEAVGPLPRPLQQPLWRSPSSTPTKKRRFSFDSLSDCKENHEDIEHHKKEISRHRHHWFRAKTPPGYWDIGFPDTQEASDINRRAAQLYAQKLGEVESEVRSGKGRYVERT